ncbi:His/Gly/Thr/Pro-type tRNA ligase C-terminal domain-containing protein, partial [Bacillus cereus]|uniref:His/Gly/Thr/Pro-type tRNA ligase C-terminal domain-containing protein n=1 Tax=Bacillus cereus TaxID=1396 RepID=UPI002840341B
FIIPLLTELKCLQIAQELRYSTSLKVQLELAGRKLKLALNYANKENIPYLLISGEDELSTETVMLRNMK